MESIRQQYLTGWKMTSELFAEKPDVNMHVDEFDMNTWMDVQVDEKAGTPAIFEDQEGKYGIYRIRTKIPESINGRLPVLHFESVWGECSVYINGELRGETARNGRDRWMWSLGKRIPEQQRYVFWSRA